MLIINSKKNRKSTRQLCGENEELPKGIEIYNIQTSARWPFDLR